MPDKQYTTITITVNGDVFRLEIEPHWTLTRLIRTSLGLTGTKEHCDEGACGMCTVIVDGRPTLSCMALAATMDGRNVMTVEGLTKHDGKLHPIQAAWVEEHGAQCGYCTPGFIMATKALLDKNPTPSTLQIKEALGGNICRCGNYEFIINSVHAAAKSLQGDQA
ncbi:MAG TPA: (2Fe-2S)-binding protein [Steroidobacteraceae bacterium]|nr:(2Fe-2S)-binding protein [Steroidobacteraceae bacterium]